MNSIESFHGWSCCYSSSSYFHFWSISLTYMIAKRRNVSLQQRYCPLPSPIAQCKQSVLLVVFSLFLLGCALPSSVGSTVDGRRLSEEINHLSKHSTAKKNKKTGWTVCPCSCLGCFRLPIPGIEPETSQSQMHHLTTGVLAISDKQLRRNGIDILV